MPTLLGSPKCQFFNSNTQEFLVGGMVYSYAAGTTTPIPTYQTIADAQAGTNPNSNPIILDQRGECNIVLNGSTKLMLCDQNNVEIWTVDNITSLNSDIVDANNRYLIKFTGILNAVNYIIITNAISGEGPTIASDGPDTDVPLNLKARGAGTLNLNSPIASEEDYVIINDDVDITGDTSITGEVDITGDTSITGEVDITGDTTTHGNLTVSGGSFAVPTESPGINVLPAGLVMYYGASTAPTGWLSCEGQAISRTTYAALFAAIGTTFGAGDGSTTFNLPNQARRYIMGKGGTGPSGSTIANTVGSTGGAPAVSLLSGNMPTTVPIASGNIGPVSINGGGTSPACPFVNGGTWTAGAGDNVVIEQFSYVMNMIIKT